MKRRLPAGVFAMAIVATVSMNSSPVLATPFDVQATQQESRVRSDDCLGWTQLIQVMGVGEREGCFLHGHSSVGTVGMPQGLRLVVQDKWTGMYGLVTGICDSGLGCQYAYKTDRLIDRQYGPYGYAGLHIYNNFLERLQPKVNFNGIEYTFDGSPASFSLQDDQQRLLHTGAFAISSNGQWVVTEVINKGVVRIDTDTFSVGRVFAPGYQYGRGMDPRHHLAVSSDGETVIITGFNAGLNSVAVDDACVEPLTFPLSDVSSAHRRCPVFASFESPIASVRSFHHPMFNRDGSHLTLRASTYDGLQHSLVLKKSGLPNVVKVDMFAMGDSFTSGEGELDDRLYAPYTNTADERCHLSYRSYPYVVSRLAGWGNPVSVACSGARIIDIVGHDDYRGQNGRMERLTERGQSIEQQRQEATANFIPGRLAQADFLQYMDAERVLLGVGGNDAGITAKVSACAGVGTCRWAEAGHRNAIHQEITRLLPDLINTYRHITSQQPAAEVVVTGYPAPINPDGRCDSLTAALFSKEEQRFMHASVSLLNSVIRIAAQAADVRFVPLDTAMKGHALCDESTTPAVNGLRYGKDVGPIKELPVLHVIGSESFHPTPFGHQLMAQSLYQHLQSGCEEACSEHTDTSGDSYWLSDGVSSDVDFIRLLPMRVTKDRLIEAIIPRALSIQMQSLSVRVNESPVEAFRIEAGDDSMTVSFAVTPTDESRGFLASITGLTDSGQRVEVYDWIPPTQQQVTVISKKDPVQSVRLTQNNNPAVVSTTSGPMIRQDAVSGAVLGQTDYQAGKLSSSQNTFFAWLIPFSYTLVLLVVSIMTVWLFFVLLLRK